MNSFRAMNKLSLNWNIFIRNILSFNRDVISILFRYHLWNVAPYMFNCIVISWYNFPWYKINSYKIFVLNNLSGFRYNRIFSFINIINHFFFNWHIFYSTVTFDQIFFDSLLYLTSWLRLYNAWRSWSLDLARARLVSRWIWIIGRLLCRTCLFRHFILTTIKLKKIICLILFKLTINFPNRVCHKCTMQIGYLDNFVIY